MKNVLTPLALALMMLVATAAKAQTPPHPTDPSATAVSTFMVSIDVSPSAMNKTGSSPLTGSDEICKIEVLVTVYATTMGAKDYVINTNSLRYVGPCAGQPTMSTQQTFALVSQMALAKGITLGHTQCSQYCQQPNPQVVRVFQSLCVQRSGFGSSTRYETCDAYAACVKEYIVCCPQGSSNPVITNIGSYNVGTCGTGQNGMPCEATCSSN